MSGAFEAAWTLLKAWNGTPLQELNAARQRLRNATVAARREGRPTPNNSLYLATHLPHIRGQAHNLRQLPFVMDNRMIDIRTSPDTNMPRSRMTGADNTGPITTPAQPGSEALMGVNARDPYDALVAREMGREPKQPVTIGDLEGDLAARLRLTRENAARQRAIEQGLLQETRLPDSAYAPATREAIESARRAIYDPDEDIYGDMY